MNSDMGPTYDLSGTKWAPCRLPLWDPDGFYKSIWHGFHAYGFRCAVNMGPIWDHTGPMWAIIMGPTWVLQITFGMGPTLVKTWDPHEAFLGQHMSKWATIVGPR